MGPRHKISRELGISAVKYENTIGRNTCRVALGVMKETTYRATMRILLAE